MYISSEPIVGIAYDLGYAPFEPKVAFKYSYAWPAPEGSASGARSSLDAAATVFAWPFPNPDLSRNDAAESRTAPISSASVPLSEYQWSGSGRRCSAERAFDFSVAAVALAILGPLLVLSALVLQSQNNGPALARQTRIGRCGREFALLSFAVSSSDGVSAEKRFLQLAGIDQLPILLNLLKGDVSLVGPRSISESELPLLGLGAIYYLRTRPGLISLAPENYDQAARMACEFEYERIRSFRSDLKLIFLTVVRLLTKPSTGPGRNLAGT